MTRDYVPIQSFDVESNSKITFDLYVHLPLNDKYILYRKKGDHLEVEKMQNFAQNNVNNFFVRKEEYNAFVKYVAVRIQSLIGNTSVLDSPQQIAKTAKSLLSTTMKQEDSAVVQAMMNNLSDITSTIIESVIETSTLGTKKTFRRLAELASTGSDSHRHPVNVASLSILITLGIGYTSHRSLSDMAIGALLHDIGLTQLPTKIAALSYDPLSLSIDERQKLYRHPIMALELLRAKKIAVSQGVVTLIMQHHEQFNGGGYPQGLRGPQVNEFAQILHFADRVDEKIIQPIKGNFNLKTRLHTLIEEMSREKIIDPFLLSRIRKVIL